MLTIRMPCRGAPWHTCRYGDMPCPAPAGSAPARRQGGEGRGPGTSSAPAPAAAGPATRSPAPAPAAGRRGCRAEPPGDVEPGNGPIYGPAGNNLPRSPRSATMDSQTTRSPGGARPSPPPPGAAATARAVSAGLLPVASTWTVRPAPARPSASWATTPSISAPRLAAALPCPYHLSRTPALARTGCT